MTRSKMMRSGWLAVAAVAVLLTVSCSDDGATGPTSVSATDGQTVKVTMSDFSFSPATISAKGGAKLTIELTNTGGAEHNFTVEALHIDKDVEAGTSTTVTVTVPDGASTPFFCQYHKARGMTGTFKLLS